MKAKTWQYIFEQFNKFGKEHGPYTLMTDYIRGFGDMIVARSHNSDKTRMIIVREM